MIQANEALKIVVGYGEPLVGRLLLFDAQGTRFDELRLKRDPECPTCGKAALDRLPGGNGAGGAVEDGAGGAVEDGAGGAVEDGAGGAVGEGAPEPQAVADAGAACS